MTSSLTFDSILVPTDSVLIRRPVEDVGKSGGQRRMS
eukprot:SAG31_NODE_30696_length_377_cov_0.917266_1_plen_36_part_10